MLDSATKALRIGRMTSSVVAAALGQAMPEASPIDAWLSVLGRDGFAGNEATLRGNLLEPLVLGYGALVAQELAAGSDPALLTSGVSAEAMASAQRYMQRPPFVAHPHHAWAGDSCDAVYTDEWGGILALGEGKTCGLGQAAKYGATGTAEVPPKVAIQARWHLMHWPDAPYCLVPVLMGGYEFVFRHYIIERDEEAEGLLLQEAEQWHRDYVLTERQPPVTARDSEYLRKLHPEATLGELEPTPELDLLAAEALDAQAERKRVEERYELARNQLREALREHSGVRGSGYSVTHHNNKESVVTDWEGLAMELKPSQRRLQKFTKLRPGPRVLRVTERKKKQQ